MKKRLCGLTLDELKNWITTLGEPGYRGQQIYNWIYQRGADAFTEMSNLPKRLRQSLQDIAYIGLPQVVQRQVAKDFTVKLLLQLEDRQSIEAVLMQYNLDFSRDRSTLCISTQVGCPIGCPFCATGKAGFIRNLDAGEIIGQVLLLRREIKRPQEGINVVFMGMGEPLLNYDSLIKSIYLLHDAKGIDISFRRMAVSTCGVVPRIYQLAQERLPINLAVSLHAPNNPLRNKLVPLNRCYPLEVLLPACWEYFAVTRRRVTFEYILLQDINDTQQHAQELAFILKGMPALVNLIPFNSTGGKYQRPSAKQIRFFSQILRDRGIEVAIREERGAEIAAACGQLRGEITGSNYRNEDNSV